MPGINYFFGMKPKINMLSISLFEGNDDDSSFLPLFKTVLRKEQFWWWWWWRGRYLQICSFVSWFFIAAFKKDQMGASATLMIFTCWEVTTLEYFIRTWRISLHDFKVLVDLLYGTIIGLFKIWLFFHSDINESWDYCCN